MIAVEGVTKQDGTTRAVDGVTFTASAGQVTGFLGPNGAGKSTTMRITSDSLDTHIRNRHISGRTFVALSNPGHEWDGSWMPPPSPPVRAGHRHER